MGEIIGLVMVGALVWLVAWSLAGESDAERRKNVPGARKSRPSQVAKTVAHIGKAA